MNTLADRVRELIDEDFYGSINRAASAESGWGIPHPTLRSILNGSSLAPRTSTLDPIVKKSGVQLEWLVYGKGPKRSVESRISRQPLQPDGGSSEAPLTPSGARLWAVGRRLGEQPDGSTRLPMWLFLAPRVIGNAIFALGAGSVFPDEEAQARHAPQWSALAIAAHDKLADAWASAIEALIDMHGVDRINAALSGSFARRAWFGFHPFGELIVERFAPDKPSRFGLLLDAPTMGEAYKDLVQRELIKAGIATPVKSAAKSSGSLASLARRAEAKTRTRVSSGAVANRAEKKSRSAARRPNRKS